MAGHLPEENEDGLGVGDATNLVVVIEERLYRVHQATLHLIYFIKYEDGSLTGRHVPSDPRL